MLNLTHKPPSPGLTLRVKRDENSTVGGEYRLHVQPAACDKVRDCSLRHMMANTNTVWTKRQYDWVEWSHDYKLFINIIIAHLGFFFRPMTDMAMIKTMVTVTSSRMMPPPTLETAATMVVREPLGPVEVTVVVGVYIAAARYH